MSSSQSGQMLLSNTPILDFDADWATEGLHFLAQIIAESRGDAPDTEYDSYDNLLTANYGAKPYENQTFIMRSFCWCEGVNKGHANGCPPNFVYKERSLQINWYKHAGRGITANQAFIGFREWFEVIQDCVNSVGSDANIA
jgi:hypothetical protein